MSRALRDQEATLSAVPRQGANLTYAKRAPDHHGSPVLRKELCDHTGETPAAEPLSNEGIGCWTGADEIECKPSTISSVLFLQLLNYNHQKKNPVKK